MFNKFVSLFFSEYDKEVKETFYKYESKINSTSIRIPSKDRLFEAFKMFSSRDDIIIDLFIEDSDALPVRPNNIEEDLEEIQDTLNLVDNIKTVELKISIVKNLDENSISIYSFDDFFRCLFQLELEHLLQDFNKLIRSNDMINFEILDGTIENFYSQSIYFNGENVQLPKPNRNKIINKRDEVSNLLNYSEISLLPSDFYLIEKSSNKEINYFFDKLSGLMSLIFISDISSINNLDELHFKINGYKLINDKFQFRDLDIDMNEIFDIYEWVYNEGTISDKVGLARNVISLNYKSDDEAALLKSNTFNSIKSGYAIYLKENVQQYIEVTNKMSEYLIDLSMKANDVIKNFGNSFRNNNLVVASFFLSVIVFNSLSAQKFTDIFSGEILGIAIVILIVSMFYLTASIYITMEQVKKFKSDYMQIKKIYRDLLNPGDLQRIFNHDYLNTNIGYVKKKVIAFSVVWGVEILSFAILLLISNISKEDITGLITKVALQIIKYYFS
jgi:hypothetical protein